MSLTLHTGFCFFDQFAHLRRQRRRSCGGNVPEYAPAALGLAFLHLHQTGKKAIYRSPYVADAPYGLLSPYVADAPYGLWASPISLSLNTATRLPCYVLTFVARIRTAIWGGIDQSGGPGGGPNSVSLFCTSTFFDSPLIRSLRPVTGEEMSVVTTRSPVASPSVT